jgi:predicted TIM-barrel fold metal-dependent hydrolase
VLLPSGRVTFARNLSLPGAAVKPGALTKIVPVPGYRAIDLTVLPFTYEVRDGVYDRNPEVREGFQRSAMWDKAFSASELIELMDEAGVEKALIAAHTGGEWMVEYDYVVSLVAQHPDRLFGQAGLDPRDVMHGVERLERAVQEYGFVGAHSYPHWFGLLPDDRLYYPFYSKCCELDVPVQIQVGKAWQRRKLNTGHPASFDAIAAHFPDLRVIGIHIGYPWEREMVSIAAKHPNVYIGADGHHPADWSSELLDYLNVTWRDPMMDGREKVLWGTNYPAVGFREGLDAVERLGLEPETQHKLLYDNVKRIYRL